MTQSGIATAADYADAMATARKAMRWLMALLTLMLLVQVVLFFVVRYKVDLAPPPEADSSAKTVAGAMHPVRYLIGLTDFLGVALPIVLATVLLLIINIMVVGRLVGVSRLVSAYVWCLVLIVLLFPWQAFLNNSGQTGPQFKIPGALYSWDELVARARTSGLGFLRMLLFWARFVGFPVVAIGLLATVHLQSRRGMRLAMGEDQVAPPATPLTVV